MKKLQGLEICLPSLDIIAPVVMCCALLWWVSGGMTWNIRLMVAAVTLVVIVCIVLIERAGFWPDQFQR